MSKAKRKKSPNADLIEVVRSHREPILQYYDQVKDERPIIVLDVQHRKLHSYSFEDYKARLRPDSHEKLHVGIHQSHCQEQGHGYRVGRRDAKARDDDVQTRMSRLLLALR